MSAQEINSILIQELFPQSLKPLKSTDKYQQSSVALILKEDKGLKILFCQRSVNPKDLHSGQVCFPGGKCDNDETDYDAVIRETHEEVGLDLTKSMYLGRLPNNFSCEFKKKRYLKMCGHIFLLNQEQKIILNESEICDERWVDLELFQDLSKVTISQSRGIQQARYLVDQTLFKHPKIQKYFKDHVVDIEMYFIDIEMNQLFYGFTSYLLCQLFEILSRNGLYTNAYSQMTKTIYNYRFYFDQPHLEMIYSKIFDHYFLDMRMRARPKL